MLVRGNKCVPWILKPDGEPVWNNEDWGRAATLEIKFQSKGVSEDERRKLIPCAVLKHKYPGIMFQPYIEQRLSELAS